MKASLVSLDYSVPDCDTSLDRLPVTIGRSRDVEIRLDDDSVSSRHCEIFRLNGQFMVRDLDSRHGTFVNGSRIAEYPLKPGDALGIGMLSFFFQCLDDEGHPLAAVEANLGRSDSR